jgi:hypothetical protein
MAGVKILACKQSNDPVYNAVSRSKRFVLRLAGLEDEAAVVAELLHRQNQGLLGTPLPTPDDTEA